MKPILLLLSAWILLLACSSLPQVVPTGDSADPQAAETCRSPFPAGDWQLWHSIEATLPGGQKGFLMGLTVISTADRTAHCVIMTLEGFVLFDAVYDKKISVKRAIAPFDSEDFANSMMEDIDLIFFKPTGSVVTSGFFKNGAAVCRYQKPDGRMVDIIRREGHRWEIRLYLPDYRLARTVKCLSAEKPDFTGLKGISDKIELNAHTAPRYALVMDLVEAVPLINPP
jgi:hypothetical protein